MMSSNRDFLKAHVKSVNLKRSDMKSTLFKTRCSSLLCLTVLVFVGLTACASNRLLSSWVDPAATGKKVENVLVIGVFRDTMARRLYENSLVRELKKEHVNGFAGHNVEAVKESITYDSVVKAAGESGARSVLITRLAEVSSKTSTSMDSVGRIYASLEDAPISADQLYLSPSVTTSSKTTVKVQLESLLYDVATRKLIWSARSEVTDPVLSNRFLDTVTSIYVADLKKKGMI